MDSFAQKFQISVKKPFNNALYEFMTVSCKYSNFTKEVYFLRYICKNNFEMEFQALEDEFKTSGLSANGYYFEKNFKNLVPSNETTKYISLYNEGNIKFPFEFQNEILERALKSNYDRVINVFKTVKGREESSIIRNFTVKLLYWIDTYFPKLYKDTLKMNRFPKFVCSGNIKLQEYLFLYYLVLMGCDMLYIGQNCDVAVESNELLDISHVPDGSESVLNTIEMIKHVNNVSVGGNMSGNSKKADGNIKSDNKIVLPLERVRKHGKDDKKQNNGTSGPVNSNSGTSLNSPLDFEELAKTASSVVMLRVFDKNGQCVKTGSGVVINSSGYILTNFHVVNGGSYYGIQLEEETDIFYTDELIKYNQYFDLAILRMEKRRRPVPVYKGGKRLVRGQKVVAIGSPLGLFNSVSDGIISGFRKLEDVSVIQFTAPVSHGSSGGALLDLYGNLIGIITAGYDDGQNLNLAVDYETIWQFANGFLK